MRTSARISAALLVFSIFTAACSSEKPRLDQVGEPAQVTVARPPVTQAPTTSDSAPKVAPWKLSPSGLGPLKVGMSVSQVSASLPGFKAPAGAATSECTYSRSPALPVGAALMFTKGSLVRIDIVSGSIQSDLGARIGDSESQLRLLYGKSVRTTPHKYTDGHYMTVLSESDSSHRIVFETDGSKVLRFRSGRVPEVEFVEVCA